jgi:hypothetical protein
MTADPRDPHPPREPPPAPGLQGLVRVLVVDNDIVHARTMGEGLSRLGYQCMVVGSGTEGARKIEQECSTSSSPT